MTGWCEDTEPSRRHSNVLVRHTSPPTITPRDDTARAQWRRKSAHRIVVTAAGSPDGSELDGLSQRCYFTGRCVRGDETVTPGQHTQSHTHPQRHTGTYSHTARTHNVSFPPEQELAQTVTTYSTTPSICLFGGAFSRMCSRENPVTALNARLQSMIRPAADRSRTTSSAIIEARHATPPSGYTRTSDSRLPDDLDAVADVKQVAVVYTWTR